MVARSRSPLRPSRAGELAWILLVTLGCAQAAWAQDSDTLRVGVDVDPSRQEQALQLEVYLNEKPTGYVASFTQRPDGGFTAPPPSCGRWASECPPRRAPVMSPRTHRRPSLSL